MSQCRSLQCKYRICSGSATLCITKGLTSHVCSHEAVNAYSCCSSAEKAASAFTGCGLDAPGSSFAPVTVVHLANDIHVPVIQSIASCVHNLT